MEKEIGIYIHIPFCVKKCYYCDFVSYSGCENKINEYINALICEIDTYNLENFDVTTIYIGGGTPSCIDSKYIVKILEHLKNKLGDNITRWKDIEITIEANPGTLTKGKLEDYKNVGINRISIGLQSTNNAILKQIGRIHTFEQFLESYKLVKDVGFPNINIDLMIGLPNQTIEDLKESLQEVIKLEPTHISVYSLIIEEGTKLESMIEKNEVLLPSEDTERNMYWYVKDTLELNGYLHYEISNFAKRGKESKHNLNCWEQKEYIGVGLAAHSYLDCVRYSNVTNLDKYIENIKNNNKDRYIIQEKQTLSDKKREYMLLGLRKIDGVNISSFKQRYGENPIYLFRNELEKLINEDLLIIDGDKIKLTNKGLDFANIVWEEFV